MKFINEKFAILFLTFLCCVSLETKNQNEVKVENSNLIKIKNEMKAENTAKNSNKVELQNKNLAKSENKNTVKVASKMETKIKTVAATKIKNKAETNLKDKRSMMEYLNGLYLKNENKEKVSERSTSSSNQSNSQIEKGPSETQNNSHNPVKLPSKILLPKKDDLRLILEDWLRISSPMFKNKARFPPISLPDGSKIEISTDHNFFRVNSAFNENTADPESPPDRLSFWFRLSGKNIYYSSSKTDVNILGAIRINNIKDAVPHNDYTATAGCFNIVDNELKNWLLCADSIDVRNRWVCKIKELLMINDDLCLNKTGEMQPTVIEKTVTQPIILIPLPSRVCNENWDYTRHGINWECDCAEGKEQSPIDLPPAEKAIDSPIRPLFQYETVSSKAAFSTLDEQMKEGEHIKIQHVDNALRIFHKYFGKIVTLDGAVYHAEEIVFHTPADHTINGKKYDMEMQVIHYGQTKGDIAKQVVLSFLFERKPGVYNKFIDDLDFFNLPNPVTKFRNILNDLFIPKVFYTADEDEIPTMRPFDFYTYQGSLPFPPCTERTIVYVAAKPLQIGSTALQLFHEALRIPDMLTQTGDVIVSDILAQNNRAIQPLNGRPVFYYKSCDIVRKKVVKPVGHYEKVVKQATKYFYVNGEEPSGLPGSFVVSKKEALGQDLA